MKTAIKNVRTFNVLNNEIRVEIYRGAPYVLVYFNGIEVNRDGDKLRKPTMRIVANYYNIRVRTATTHDLCA